MMLGAKGALVALAAGCTGLLAEMVKTHADRRYHRFHALVPSVEALSRAVFAPPAAASVQRLLWTLELTGVLPAEAAWDPDAPELPAEEKDRLRQTLEDLGQVEPPKKTPKSEEEKLDEFLARRD